VDFDVVVVGGGNAGLCAALSAQAAGARVLVLERAPKDKRGGNSYFTGGSFRFAYGDREGLARVCDHPRETLDNADFSPYDEDEFYGDLCRVTNYRTDPELAGILVGESMDGMLFLRENGVRFELQFNRQSFKENGRHRFWGGSIVQSVGAGAGLIDSLFETVNKRGITVWYGARGRGLMLDAANAVCGVRGDVDGQPREIACRAVILSAGGFQANPQWRAAYLGAGFDLAKVRGTEFNTGDGIQMALDAGAQPFGHWSGAHAVGWEANAPPFGDRRIGDLFNKHSYPLSVMLNKAGRRFVDEGADWRNYTYAKYGREILAQPEQIAFQIYDQKSLPMLRDEYRIAQVTRTEANTFEELAVKLEVDPVTFAETLNEYNAAVSDVPFNPAIKDGKRTNGITPPKSNWAQLLDTPPYVAFSVTCGVTFTFGGVHITPDAHVLNTEGREIRGLFACGEMVGGIFYHNYPGGSGLMAGTVFGRRAGREAAALARTPSPALRN